MKASINLFTTFIVASLLAVFTAPSTSEAQLVRISGMSDFAFGTWSGSNNLTSSDTVCVYKSSGGNTYTVTATGSGAGSAFTVASAGNTLAYGVRWKQNAGSFQSLTSGNAQAFSGAHTSSPTCSGADTAELEVQFTSTNLEAARAGAYTGTLTILISPS